MPISAPFKKLAVLWAQAETSSWAQRALAFVGLLVAGIILFHLSGHAMWRDELQAYTIARDSTTLASFFHNISYEGFPPLWFLLLKALQFVTPKPEAMQVLHGFLALLNVFLLARFAPMHPVLRILLIVAYPFSFQFALTSRCYAVGITFLLAALVAKDRGKPFLYWLFLGVAAHSTLLITSIACMLGVERFLAAPRQFWKEKGGVALFSVLVLLALWAAMPNPDRLTVADIAAGRPAWYFMQAWLMGWQVPLAIQGNLPALLVLLFFLGLAWVALDGKKAAFAAWLLGVGAFFFVDRVGYPLSFYHMMLLPVGFIALVWQTRTLEMGSSSSFSLPLAGRVGEGGVPQTPSLEKQSTALAGLPPPLILPRKGEGKRELTFSVIAFVLLFAFLSFAGVKSFFYTSPVPYSQGRNVALWIKQEGLQEAFWIGMPDYAATTVSGYLGRLFYFPQCNCMGAAPHWSKSNARTLPLDATLKKAEAVMREKNLREAWLLLGTGEMQKEPAFLEKVEGLRAYQKKSFLGAVMHDEQFFVYHLMRD